MNAQITLAPTRMDPAKINQQQAAAYHEAGHAIVALLMGWEIGPEGVEIEMPNGGRDYCALRMRVIDRTEDAIAAVFLAGWLSELRWHDSGGRKSESRLDMAIMIDLLRDGEDGPDYRGDDWDVLSCLVEKHPDATDAEILAMFREHEQRTADLIAEPQVWTEIERLAGVLAQRGKLSPDEVEAVLMRSAA